MGRTAIILGPTGLVGSYVLDLLLKNKEYDLIYAVTRRKIEKEHPKLKQIPADYEDLEYLRKVVCTDDIFCCLGTTIKKAKSKENFEKIDYQYPLNCAKIGAENGCRRFLLVSAIGAHPKSSNFYLKTKGKLEKDIQHFAYESIKIFQPSFLKGNRIDFRLMEQIMLPIVSFFAMIIPTKYSRYYPIEAYDVANAMVKSALNNQIGFHLLQYNEMIAISNNYQKIKI